jgi:hypothetical protein
VANVASPIENSIVCHWYCPTVVLDNQQLCLSLQKDDLLLIGAPLHHNNKCRYALSNFEIDRVGHLPRLGTAPSGYRPETYTLDASGGYFVNFNLSVAHKKHPGTTTKESIYSAVKNDPEHANIFFLNDFYGVEISHHSGNARRVRLRDLFQVPTVDRRLEFFNPGWKTTDWGAPFSAALANNNSDALEAVWGNTALRKGISALICELLVLLHHTGENDQRLTAAYFSQHHGDDKQVVLRVSLNKWAKCLHDTSKNAAYVVVCERCLQPKRLNCDAGFNDDTRLETLIAFTSKIPRPGKYIRLIPHEGCFKVQSIRQDEIILIPTSQRNRAKKAYEVQSFSIGDGPSRRRAFIKAGVISHGGFQTERTIFGQTIKNPRRPPQNDWSNCCIIL